MIVLRDEENFEAECIAEKLKKLGLAHFFKNQDESSIIDQVCEIISPNNKSRYLDQFELCKLNGVSDAASFLSTHWNLIGRPK
jgi:hypothetical protein